MTFDIALLVAHGPEILQAAEVTASVWVASAAGGIVLGFLVAVGRRTLPFPAAAVLRLPVEILRGTPFLVQLFLLYFGGPYIGLSLDAVPAGLLGLTCYGAAYYSEIFRAGFAGVPIGHIEAAACVGLSGFQTMRRIILPEMSRLVLPALVNMTIVLLKETAVLSIITVPELTMVISGIGSESYAFVESLFCLALTYWALVELCGAAGRLAEARVGHIGVLPR